MTPAQRRAVERLSEQLEKMSKRPGDAADHEKNADRLREQARRLYESASPEQRERMERWMQQAATGQPPGGNNNRPDSANPGRALAQTQQSDQGDRGQRGGSPGSGSTRGGGEPVHDFAAAAGDQPVRTTPVDARSAEDLAHSGHEQVVAEWLGSGDDRRTPAEKAAVVARLQQAARSAEEAIGDRVVPSRYDRILREYFRRLPAKVAPGATPAQPAPAPAPAPDGGQGGPKSGQNR